MRRVMDIGDLSERLLVFGGPYSNLAATQALRKIADAEGIGARHVICTGDTVAYCAEPDQTVAAIRDWGCSVVMGNCEQALASGSPDCGCGFAAGSSCAVLSDGWYLLLNPTDQGIRATWHRLVYPHAAASTAMRQAGLSAGYADCLENGRWPSLDVLPDTERRRSGQRLNPAPLTLV